MTRPLRFAGSPGEALHAALARGDAQARLPARPRPQGPMPQLRPLARVARLAVCRARRPDAAAARPLSAPVRPPPAGNSADRPAGRRARHLRHDDRAGHDLPRALGRVRRAPLCWRRGRSRSGASASPSARGSRRRDVARSPWAARAGAIPIPGRINRSPSQTGNPSHLRWSPPSMRRPTTGASTARDAISLTFLTPTRLVAAGATLRRPEPDVLLRRVAERIDAVAASVGVAPPNLLGDDAFLASLCPPRTPRGRDAVDWRRGEGRLRRIGDASAARRTISRVSRMSSTGARHWVSAKARSMARAASSLAPSRCRPASSCPMSRENQSGPQPGRSRSSDGQHGEATAATAKADTEGQSQALTQTRKAVDAQG